MFTLENVVPSILQNRGTKHSSTIWGSTLELSKGSFIKVMAPSGTGKTTLIHFLYALRKDYTGKIAYGNQDILHLSGDELAHHRQQYWSIIFQDLRLFPQLTARENIALNSYLQTPYYADEAINSMAEELGIGHILEQPAYQCSYGEQQRIAIIRALVQPFSILLMDEPFSHLDKANKQIAAALIQRECNQRSAGLIMADLDEDAHFSYTHTYTL